MGSPQEWQEAEVCQWLSEVFQAPQELVQMVEQQAITGKVLLPGGKAGNLGRPGVVKCPILGILDITL